MKRVLVIGASRGIGLEVVKATLVRGHQVRAFSRAADRIPLTSPYLEKHSGDALNSKDVERALEGVEVVVQCLGVRIRDLLGPITLFSRATAVLVPAMERKGIKRLIVVTGYGAGKSRETIQPLQRLPFKVFFGRAYDDKTIQEALVEKSNLDWTIVRPGMLTNGPSRQKYQILVAPEQWRNGIISRGDVAHFIVSEIDAAQHIKQAPVLVG